MSDLHKQFYKEKVFVELVNYFKSFKPKKIVVEVNKDFQDELHHQYVRFLQGEYDLQQYEVDQIAFRLAKECRLETLYAVDWNESLDIVPNLGELKTNKSKNELEKLLQKAEKQFQEDQDFMYRHSIK